MKKYTNIDFSKQFDLNQRLQTIKNIGFDGIFIWQFEDEEKIANIVTSARALDLDIETMHLRFTNCNHLWLDDELGRDYVNIVKRGVELAALHKIPTVIMHTVSKEIHPPFNELGLKRIQSILDLCEKHQVNLAIENIRKLEYIDYVFENLSSPYLKMCFDFGHSHCFAYKLDNVVFEKYQDYIICLHIHDNFGENDDHFVAFEGEIDIPRIVHSLAKISYHGPLTNEAHKRINEDISDFDFLTKVFQALVRIEKLFEEARV